jgi:DNA processing protein
MDQVKYWVGFNKVSRIGPVRLQMLLDRFGDAGTAWNAPPLELARAGLDRTPMQNLLKLRAELDLDAEMRRIESAGVQVLTTQDDAYPRLLRQIDQPPPVLYVKGTLRSEDEWAVAIVGTRHMKASGVEMTRYLAGDLARNRITVVSGLARGIDTEAHRSALDAGGRTIAVLGSGLDVIYPYENAALAKDIAACGALVSEFPLGTKPERTHFPQRNRIISGLSLGTLITQAGVGSGAMITAHFALNQGREVFAVPGSPLDRGFSGTNRMIQQGEAKLVVCAQDVLEELNLSMISQQAEMRAIAPENETEAALLHHLSEEPVHVDDLRRASGLPIAQVSATLALLELKGLVRQTGGMQYVLAREARPAYSLE